MPALRVRADATVVEFEDRVLGPQSGVVDDFVVRRNDGAFAYNLAVVVDDAAQGIEEVVRGADLARLHAAADLARPGARATRSSSYAHVPLVLNADGRRLAKRDGDVTLREVDAGEAVQWMAESLGLAGATARELLAGFDPAAVPREPTIWTPIGSHPSE